MTTGIPRPHVTSTWRFSSWKQFSVFPVPSSAPWTVSNPCGEKWPGVGGMIGLLPHYESSFNSGSGVTITSKPNRYSVHAFLNITVIDLLAVWF